jgi:hypothetical protein
MMIIPPRRGTKQSQCRDNPITGRIPIIQETQKFSAEVHVLAGMLVRVVLTNT